MGSPSTGTPGSSILVNIIDCRAAGNCQPLIRQVRNSHPGHRCGVESGWWRFPSSSQPLNVEMRRIQDVDPNAVWLQVPTVVIVVYDAADDDSMKRLTGVLEMKTSTWLPQGCQLALASSGSTSSSGRPVRRLKARAKKHMGVVQVFDLHHPVSTMQLLLWTLVVATTHGVTGFRPDRTRDIALPRWTTQHLVEDPPQPVKNDVVTDGGLQNHAKVVNRQ